MPTITINKKGLKGNLSLDELKDRISMLGTDLESIDENEINVEIFPDRPDMLSEQGFARAFNSFINVETGLKKYKVEKSNEKVIIDKSVKEVRPFTACAIVKNLRFDDEKIKEVIQIQEKLHVTYGRNRKKVAIGIYPYEKIKPPIRFFAESPDKIKFIPLEFDKEITGLQILSMHPTGREYGYLLEGKDKFPFFEDSNKRILSMPPSINSNDVGKISNETKDVFIECSGFDFNVLSKCLNIIVCALADMGGRIYSMEIIDGNKKTTSPDLRPGEMKLNLKHVNKILGLELKDKEVKKYLERMGYDYSSKTVKIPAYRADIISEIDLTEDIAIAYGYENFKEEIPEVATIAEENKFEIFKRKISELLIGLNLIEVNTYHLINSEINKRMNLNIENVKLENSISEEYNSLRSWMMPCLMDILEKNKNNEYPQNIFEIGTIFRENLEENDRLALVLCDKDANFTKIKQILDYLMRMLNLNYSIEEVEHDSFISGRTGRVIVNNKKIGYIGEINPKVLDNFNLEVPVSALEINLTELFSLI